MKFLIYHIFISLCFFNCEKSDDTTNESLTNSEINITNQLYFPPINSDLWESVSVEDLNWNNTNLNDLYSFLENTNTKGFIILKDGRIAIEWYGNGANANTNIAWNSAGKTLSAFTTGIAQEEGFLDINDASNIYLGNGWTSLTQSQENEITILNHLTMTTGLDYNVPELNCYLSSCLTYLDEPNSFWYYHNAPYTLIQNIVSEATNLSFINYFDAKLKNKIGMQGSWITLGYSNVYFSNTRSMARFGLLNLNKGIWDSETILNDASYFEAMTNSSQDFNKSYGYLWWLNGKESHKLPGTTLTLNGKLIPNAPDDLIAGLGKDDKKLYVIPSKNMVVIRLGDSGGSSTYGPSGYDNELWEKINLVVTD